MNLPEKRQLIFNNPTFNHLLAKVRENVLLQQGILNNQDKRRIKIQEEFF